MALIPRTACSCVVITRALFGGASEPGSMVTGTTRRPLPHPDTIATTRRTNNPTYLVRNPFLLFVPGFLHELQRRGRGFHRFFWQNCNCESDKNLGGQSCRPRRKSCQSNGLDERVVVEI